MARVPSNCVVVMGQSLGNGGDGNSQGQSERPGSRKIKSKERKEQSWAKLIRERSQPEAHVCFDRHLKIAAGSFPPHLVPRPLLDTILVDLSAAQLPVRDCVGRRCHFHRFGLFLAEFWKAAARAAKAGTETSETG